MQELEKIVAELLEKPESFHQVTSGKISSKRLGGCGWAWTALRPNPEQPLAKARLSRWPGGRCGAVGMHHVRDEFLAAITCSWTAVDGR
jgi:hypothetical protein